MNQIPTNASTNGEGAPAEQAAAAPARPRRARRPATRAKAQAQSAATAQTQAQAPTQPQPHTAPAPQQPAAETPATPATPAPARPRRAASRSKSRTAAEQPQPQPAAQAQPAQPQPEQPLQPAAEAAAAGTGAQAQPAKRARTRSHRGGRKNAVQLVKPETPAGEGAIPFPSGEMPLAEATGTQMVPAEPALGAVEAHEAPEGVRTVPVVTEEPTGAELPLPTPQEPPAAPAKRYRFERRAPAAAIPGAAPMARPERLSGPATEAAAQAEPVPFTTLREQAPAEEREEPAAAPEEAPETWRATVAEVAPETLAHTAAETRAEEAVEDLVSALGLRPMAPSGPAAEEAEAEAGEEAAEAETEGEAQATARRPRRRRRGGRGGATAAGEEAAEGAPLSPIAEPEWPAVSEGRNGFERHAEISPFEQPYSPYHRPARERTVPAAQAEHLWEAGPTEAPRPSEAAFSSPEPQMARGFGPQPRGVAGPAPTSFQRAPRERGVDVPPMSPNQLGMLVTHAIQQQTDRLLNELRYQPQGPSMTVALPMPTTERIGVFVDVANLHYSARTQRITLDFGKLLEFLRGNRRLIRAQAYAPTNPEPGAEQTFLSAVRGLGYRITTKNFKTFASGAKKADMDLDLCMDIVRLVDAGALDTVVLVSGDSDFLPLLEYCSDHGVRVEVAAFDDSAAMILRQSCDLFINLSLVEGIQRR